MALYIVFIGLSNLLEHYVISKHIAEIFMSLEIILLRISVFLRT